MNYEQEVAKLLKNTDAIHLVAGLAAECGEVCGVFQKASYKKHKVNTEELKLELGDVIFYVTAFALEMGSSIEELQNLNINKLNKRHSRR